MIEFELLKRIIEAAILASGNPLTPAQLLGLFENPEAVSHEEIARALESLQADSANRGIELVEVASGFRYQVRHDVHAWVARLWTEKPSRYSRALLETLALIAYRQPITRAETLSRLAGDPTDPSDPIVRHFAAVDAAREEDE